MSDKKKTNKTNYLLGGSLLGGLGLKALSNNLKPEILDKFKTTENIDRLTNRHLSDDDSIQNSFRVLKEYANTGSELMNSSVLGLEPKTIIKSLRSLPFISESNKWKGEASDLHYDAFKNGPLTGFVRYFDERFEKDQMPQQEIGLLDKLMGKFEPKSFRHNFSDFVNKHVEENTGIKNFISGRGLSDVPIMNNAENLSHNMQKQLLDSLGERINSSGSSELKEKIRENAHAAYDSYAKYDKNLITPLHGLAEGLNTVGNTLLTGGLLGGLGYGSYKLYQHLKNKNKEKQGTDLTSPVKPSPFLNTLQNRQFAKAPISPPAKILAGTNRSKEFFSYNDVLPSQYGSVEAAGNAVDHARRIKQQILNYLL